MDRRAAKSANLIRLGGREVEYRFVRRRRRTLGITVDADGLKLSAPLRAPWRDIEQFVREKERWILAKLDEWAVAPRPAVVRGRTGERMALFGELVELERRAGPAQRQGDRVGFDSLPSLVKWLKAAALEALLPRVAHYAARLGRVAPHVRLSNARTQWGVCTEDGTIRLCWRLVHIEPALADYVVAHESAHLVELNHSRRFYRLLASLYPDWVAARERLELAGAALPILKETK
ncbi:MAG TPA: SprT family zinc-dependent metalloprotease [Burkholderiales bacterium]|nr:SprT family zinc-dependent metalloprotease [Burkholderiales bacterium]